MERGGLGHWLSFKFDSYTVSCIQARTADCLTCGRHVIAGTTTVPNFVASDDYKHLLSHSASVHGESGSDLPQIEWSWLRVPQETAAKMVLGAAVS